MECVFTCAPEWWPLSSEQPSLFHLWDVLIQKACSEDVHCLKVHSDDEGGQILNEKNQDSDQGMISPSSMTLFNTLIIQSTCAEKPEKGNITGILFS